MPDIDTVLLCANAVMMLVEVYRLVAG